MRSIKKNKNGLNYNQAGEGQPVILIHGMAASLECWAFQSDALVEAGFGVFAVDLPGHGESVKPRGSEEYSIDSIFQHLVNWIESLDLAEPAIVIGHSLGGYLSCMLAIRRPDLVKKMVLADPFYSKKQLFPLLRLTVRQPEISATLYKSAPSWAVRSVLTLIKNRTVDLPVGMLRQTALDLRRASPQILFIPPTIEDLTPEFHRINIPTLVLWGENDLTLSPDSFPPLLDSIPNASGRVFAHCGHIPHLSHADIFNQEVLAFINRADQK